jgi:hypothetical protein
MLSGNLPSAERVEGDMAWGFGVGQRASVQHVDVQSSAGTEVCVGGLTSVCMVPRTVIHM